eukprot:scaffold17.g463.t1
MGKPQKKKKNAGVGVDFKRVKHRVGKKLPRAQNQTDTTFKSRSISLPQQSVAVDKGGAAVTHRNLTLKLTMAPVLVIPTVVVQELLGQCGHYSERVRRDAVAGLAELGRSHPEELCAHASAVVEAAAERVTDGDAGVRGAVRDALASAILPALGAAALEPFALLLMAHVGSAMTHLADPIRADALGFLELLTEWRADLVAGASLAPALQHYADLLSRGSRGRSIKAGSLASLATIVASLERFLSRTLDKGSSASSAGFSAAWAAERAGLGRDTDQPPDALRWRRCCWPPTAAASSQAAAAAEGGGGTSSRGTASSSAEAAARELLGHLLQCWSECGPSQLAESPDLATAQCVAGVLRCCDLLLTAWGVQALGGSPTSRESLSAALLAKVSPHFPVHLPAVPLPPGVADQLVQVNVAAAQLLCHFLPALAGQAGAGSGGATPAQPHGHGQPVLSMELEQGWAARLLDWFAEVMADGSALPAAADGLAGRGTAAGHTSAGSSASGRGRQPRSIAGLPAAVYESALAGTAGVLPLVVPQQRRHLLAAVLALWERSPLRSQPRGLVLAFWRRLLADPAASLLRPVGPTGEPLVLHEEGAAWLAALPKFIYQLGVSSSSTSNSGSSGAVMIESALRLLLDAARLTPAGTPLAAVLDALQPQLAPLFGVLLLPAGKQQQQQQWRMHVGPLARQPRDVQASACMVWCPCVCFSSTQCLTSTQAQEPELYACVPFMQELAVDCLAHMPSLADVAVKAAAFVCRSDAFSSSIALRLLDAAVQHAAAGTADLSAVLGLLLGALSGSSVSGASQQQLQWRRHEELVEGACRAALRLGQPAAVAAALVPPLLHACEASEEATSSTAASTMPLALHGLLRLVYTVAEAAGGPPERLGLVNSSSTSILSGELLDRLPRLILSLPSIVTCQAASEGANLPSVAQAASLCAQVVAVLPVLLPAVLDAVACGLRQATSEADSQAALTAVLPLLLELAQAAGLRPALLEQASCLRAVLDCCTGALAGAGNTAAPADIQQQLLQLFAVCAISCGWEMP